MRRSGFLLLLFIFSCGRAHNHFTDQIGTVSKGKPKLTADETVLKEKWARLINDDPKININFSTVQILSEKSGEYYLLAADLDAEHKARIDLVEEKGILYEKRINDGSMTVVCFGCFSSESLNSDCMPKLDSSSNSWFCTDCKTNGCSKSTAYSARSILGSAE